MELKTICNYSSNNGEAKAIIKYFQTFDFWKLYFESDAGYLTILDNKYSIQEFSFLSCGVELYQTYRIHGLYQNIHYRPESVFHSIVLTIYRDQAYRFELNFLNTLKGKTIFQFWNTESFKKRLPDIHWYEYNEIRYFKLNVYWGNNPNKYNEETYKNAMFKFVILYSNCFGYYLPECLFNYSEILENMGEFEELLCIPKYKDERQKLITHTKKAQDVNFRFT